MLAAHRAYHVLMLRNKGIHLIKTHRIHVDFRVLLTDQLVGPVARLAGFAVEQRVGEAGHMPGSNPCLGVHENRGVKPHVVRAFLHELLQPRLLHVVLELGAEGAVVPAVGQAAVDLTAGVDVAAVFAQCNDLVESFFALFHSFHPFPWLDATEIIFICPGKLPTQ